MAALPALLKLLTSRAALSLPQAMKAARSLMPHGHATADALSQLSIDDLQALGVDDSEAKKIVSAFGSAGKAKGKKAVKRKVGGDSGGVGAGPSSSTAPVKKQKKEYRDPFEIPLQDGPLAGEKSYPALNYGLDLTVADLLDHEVKINRAPIMTAWSLVVCKRLGFSEEEALSLAQSFTDANATSKAISLGIKPKPSEAQARASTLSIKEGEGWQQPHVVLMGRKPVMTIPPVYDAAAETNFPPPPPTYRALSSESSESIPPSLAGRYLNSSLGSDLPYILGAFSIVAESYTTAELQGKAGWEIYVGLRPETEGWGKKGLVRIRDVLALEKDAERKGKEVEEKERNEGEDAYDDAKYWEGFDFDDADIDLDDIKPIAQEDACG